MPVFVSVEQIVIFNDEKYIKCIELQVDFNEHINAFKVAKKLQESVEYINTSTMTYSWPQINHIYSGIRHIIPACVDNAWQM